MTSTRLLFALFLCVGTAAAQELPVESLPASRRDASIRRESIVESYDTSHVGLGAFVSGGMQWVVNPGYNRDRGPVLVGILRLHVDF
jgi:carbohydrate-selective porin OprB